MGIYNQSTTAAVTATPAIGWQFVTWTGEGITDPNIPSTSVLVETAQTVTANSARIRHFLTVEASPAEGATTKGGGLFDQGGRPRTYR